MVKRQYFYIILFLANCVCLNLSQAQTSPAPVNVKGLFEGLQNTIKNPTAAPTPAPAPAPAPAPTPAPAATTNPLTNVNGQQPNNQNNPNPNAPGEINANTILNAPTTAGKFEEYLSMCRTREFDKIQYQSKDQLNEKLKELKTQADAYIADKAGGNLEEAFHVMAELISLEDKKIFDNLSASVKSKVNKPQDVARANALIAFSKRNLRDARTNFIKALAEDEKNEEILKILAEVYKKESNFFEASAIYEDLNKDKKNAYLAELCESMVLNSLNADGEIVCLQASKKFPDNPFPLIFAGITFRERLDLKKARDYFKRSLEIRQTEMGNICLAELSLMENKPDQAVEFFKVSAQQSPFSKRATMGLAWSQMKAHAYGGALETFRKGCQTDRKFEVEVRKAYKILLDEKVGDAEKFMTLALHCGTN